MRIGMLGPITHPYPPLGYGPWERVTHDLTESLVAAGHEVVLFAPETSQTSARLVATVPTHLQLLPEEMWRKYEDRHINNALAAIADLDLEVVHSHLHVHVLDHPRRRRFPLVSTLHGVAWGTDVHPALRWHARENFVSISNREREFLPDLNYVATVPNGINTAEFPIGDGGSYLAFVGRLAPEKAPHLAVETARKFGMHLLLAGTIEDRHNSYAASLLAGLGDDADYLGPLERDDLAYLLGGAYATLMPLRWDEPFGLVVVESLAAGTPVVAWNRGAMPEVVDDGLTGYLVRNVDEAVAALAKVSALSRAHCARVARERFDRSVMADGYADVYLNVAASSWPQSIRRSG